ncbi:MAG: phosphodiester glycosidase family protein [Clostridiales bacterium]|jgi:hypothetical protein|nr:phosphodiester glycosidase family protein [Clostridiales bacterium]
MRPAALAAAPSHAARATALASAAIAAALLLAPAGAAHAIPFTIYETVSESAITKGVTLEEITRFTSGGWLSADVLRVDLSDSRLSVDALYDSASLKSLATVGKLAESSGAVAAINGGFFVSEGAGMGNATGAMMRSGLIDSLFGETNAFGDVMGSITISGGAGSAEKLAAARAAQGGQEAGAAGAGAPAEETAAERRARLKREAAQASSASAQSAQASGAKTGAQDGNGIIESLESGASGNATQSVIESLESGTSGTSSQSIIESPAAAGSASAGRQAAMKALIDYCRPTIKLIGGGGSGAQLAANAYNKYSFYDYKDIVIMDRKWASRSIGASSARPDIVELVVDNGAVAEIRDGMPPVAIPANGFVAVTRKKEDGSHPFGDAFRPGSPASFQTGLAPTLDNAVMHIEGASILVKDGKIPASFSYVPKDLAPRNPRTMIGVSQDGGQLIMAVVDGRQSSSIGLDTLESAEFMLSLGAYSALNLDGGGSTTMVARSPGEFGLSAVNSYSDASMRPVINGIGVFTDAPKASIRSIYIEAGEYSVFVGTNRQFAVKAADRYGNPVEVDPASVVWSVSGFRGAIKGGLLQPRTAGDGFVSAKIGRATAEIAVKSLPSPAELVLSKTSLELGAGESFTFAATGRDSMGFSARINPADISWAVSGDGIGAIKDGVFTRSGDGAASGYVTAALGDARAYCAVPAAPAASGAAGAGAAAPPAVELPAATRIKDSAAGRADWAPAAGSFRFGVLGEAGDPATGAEKAASAAFAKLLGKELEMGAYVGSGSHKAAAAAPAGTAFATGSEFEALPGIGGSGGDGGSGGAKLLRLSTAGNGIRAAGIYQWGNLLDELENFRGKALFIVMQQAPATFSDKLEAALFKERLASCSQANGYSAWVFYSGASDSVWLEDGVRYFSCAGAKAPGVDAETGAGARYLRVAYKDGAVTYSYEPLA